MIGQKIGETYELLRLLGQGAMGVVYEAKHVDTGRHVAVKLITDEAAREERLRSLFEREAQTTAKILSPHIVEILGTGCDAASGHPYLVMELLAGENVEQLLARCGRLDPDLVARIGAQACLGLQKAHQAGVVHRDIKPGNLFLARSQGDEVTVKLLDFAVGTLKMDRASATGNESLARSGSIIGSPMYMSPEQARALKSLDYRTDLWSLGMVLYELLSGKPPHHDSTGLGDLIIAICAEEPAPIHDVVPAVPKPLSDALHGALRLAVDERYAGAQQMLAALDAALPSGRRISAAMLTAGRTAPVAASPLAGIFDGTPVMEATSDDPTQASAKSEANPRGRPSSPPGIAVEVANDGPTVSSPIEALVLSAAPLAAAPGGPNAARDEGLFGPASIGIEQPVADAPHPAAAKAGPLGSSLGRAALAVTAGLLVGIAGTIGYGVVAPPDASSAPSVPPPSTPRSSATDTRPIPSTAPTAEPSAASTAEVAQTTVRVKVTPPFGAVAVDGARVDIKDGSIEITGPVDSAHDVVLTVGGRSVTARILLTADGPKPSEIIFPGAGGPGGRRPKGKLPDIYE